MQSTCCSCNHKCFFLRASCASIRALRGNPRLPQRGQRVRKMAQCGRVDGDPRIPQMFLVPMPTPSFTMTGRRCDGCVRVAPPGFLPLVAALTERGLCTGCERLYRIQMLLSRLNKEEEAFEQADRLLNLAEIYISDTVSLIPGQHNSDLARWEILVPQGWPRGDHYPPPASIKAPPPYPSEGPYPPLASIKAPPPCVDRTYPLDRKWDCRSMQHLGKALGVAGGWASPMTPAQEAAPVPAKKPPPPRPPPGPPPPPANPPPTTDDESPEAPPVQAVPVARPLPASPPGPKQGYVEQEGHWVWVFQPRLETVQETRAIGTPPEQPEYSSDPERSGPEVP